jgi:hypothetical protein
VTKGPAIAAPFPIAAAADESMPPETVVSSERLISEICGSPMGAGICAVASYLRHRAAALANTKLNTVASAKASA